MTSSYSDEPVPERRLSIVSARLCELVYTSQKHSNDLVYHDLRVAFRASARWTRKTCAPFRPTRAGFFDPRPPEGKLLGRILRDGPLQLPCGTGQHHSRTCRCPPLRSMPKLIMLGVRRVTEAPPRQPNPQHCAVNETLYLRSRSLPETKPSYLLVYSNTHKGVRTAYSDFRGHFTRSCRCRVSHPDLVLTCCSSGRQGSDIFRTICSSAQAPMRKHPPALSRRRGNERQVFVR